MQKRISCHLRLPAYKSVNSSMHSIKMTELQKKIYVRIEGGDRFCDIAKDFGIHVNTVTNARKLYEASGRFKKRPSSGRPCSVCTKPIIDAVRKKISQNLEHSMRQGALHVIDINAPACEVQSEHEVKGQGDHSGSHC